MTRSPLLALALLVGLSCGGTSSGTGTGGGGGTGTGGAGAVGSGGSMSGTGGSAGGTGGAGHEGGGAGGAAAGHGGGAGGAAAGHGGAGAGGGCGVVECLRANQCVATCGGPVQYTGCCPCVAPLFDSTGACGDGGSSAVSYLGCSYVGGIDRFVVAKRDTARNLCFSVVLDAPGTTPAGLTLPANLGLEWSFVGPASPCPARLPSSTRAATTTGTVTETAGGVGMPSALDVDVTLTFAADAAPASESLSAHAVDVTPGCP
jgi:hypothetical protein